ncbi:hypothetical protein JTE90_014334 [Oedothorax gibbosus]|uniref:C2H2-type domain-containing protein n=1 Tax=Oedothorax gibbosus TaxID=931172 RepID=A0AAV6TU54_9ARAC|nr:hypothetical protein JTE90_014334 [Oedothorax gibbosus]
MNCLLWQQEIRKRKKLYYRNFVKKDLSRQFMPNVISIDEQQFNTLESYEKEITKSVFTKIFQVLFRRMAFTAFSKIQCQQPLPTTNCSVDDMEAVFPTFSRDPILSTPHHPFRSGYRRGIFHTRLARLGPDSKPIPVPRAVCPDRISYHPCFTGRDPTFQPGVDLTFNCTKCNFKCSSRRQLCNHSALHRNEELRVPRRPFQSADLHPGRRRRERHSESQRPAPPLDNQARPPTTNNRSRSGDPRSTVEWANRNVEHGSPGSDSSRHLTISPEVTPLDPPPIPARSPPSPPLPKRQPGFEPLMRWRSGSPKPTSLLHPRKSAVDTEEHVPPPTRIQTSTPPPSKS